MRLSHLLICVLLSLPLHLCAQQKSGAEDITGLWKGTLYNDTTQQYYKYEIGISEDKNGLSGFSHTWFILDDKQYYGVKKVKIKKEGGKIIVEDAGLIANNYPVAPAKGVKQLNVLELNVADSIMTLTGSFTTNRTKDYRPLTGTIILERKDDYWQSALVPHLQELNLTNKLSFVEDENLLARNNIAVAAAEKRQISARSGITQQPVKVMDTKAIPTLPAANPDKSATPELASANKTEPMLVDKTALAKTSTPERKTILQPTQENATGVEKSRVPVSAIGKRNIPAVQADLATSAGIPVTKGNKVNNSAASVSAPGAASTPQIITKPPVAVRKIGKSEISTDTDHSKLKVNKADSVYAIVLPAQKIIPVDINNSGAKETVYAPAIPGVIASNEPAGKAATIQGFLPALSASAALNVMERTTSVQQTVSFHSDSLQLSLYDNGEVDGDTVSVLMNGNIIMARERLSTNAVRKTIFIPQTTDTVQLLMYAENLGSIPPNTGLLVVKDGKDLYEIRFSGDLQKNAAIIFKRKKEIPK